MSQNDCPHTNLTVLGSARRKLRCRHCHLTIDAEELSEGYCPECYEATGDQRYDFDRVASANRGIRYRCEECGLVIENDPPH
jgi:hypothetical protein